MREKKKEKEQGRIQEKKPQMKMPPPSPWKFVGACWLAKIWLAWELSILFEKKLDILDFYMRQDSLWSLLKKKKCPTLYLYFKFFPRIFFMDTNIA